jgi:homoserine O-acetyltransferase
MKSLGIKSIRLFVGASYGGMVGLAFASEFPQSLEQLCVISAAHRSHPMAMAWRHAQQLILKALPSAVGVSLARALAMTTYRSPEEFAERFDYPDEVAKYLDGHGSRSGELVHPEAYYCLSRSTNAHRIAEATLSQLQVPTTLVGVTEDRLVPIELMRELADLSPFFHLVEFSSIFGHDAFLKEPEIISDIIRIQLDDQSAVPVAGTLSPLDLQQNFRVQKAGNGSVNFELSSNHFSSGILEQRANT